MKSVSASFRYNPRNMENPWYGLWAHELLKMAEPFNNLIIVPQYTLWFTMSDDEPVDEEIEEINEDTVSEIGDEGDDLDEGETHESDDSDDEPDTLRDKDENIEPIEDQNPATLNAEQDPDTSITESLFTVRDGSAPQLTPDFVALHILAEKLRFPTNARLRRRYERRAGYRITHGCCPLIMEIKSFPSRSLTPARFKRELAARLGTAKQELGFQCYHLFKRYQHALRTIAVIASGDHWTHLIVSRSDVPRGAGDEMNTETWDSLEFPNAVILGTPASDLRMGEISDYLRHTKPDLPSN
ncbi:hypothetical protein BYT27DRAFT_7089352 [Phlegmacium glaucopus]|nr:hypothetical protein BYT27DRAFT_7089352 [Phlegmacium glaucopus]